MEEDKKQLFKDLVGIYRQALQIDPEDVEANFNMAMLYLSSEY